jgi:hypothetical protein
MGGSFLEDFQGGPVGQTKLAKSAKVKQKTKAKIID